MNRALLAQVRDQVLAETDKFNMNQWTQDAHNPWEVKQGVGRVDEDGVSCGTTACLAGWAMTLDALDKGYSWSAQICHLQIGFENNYFGDVAAQVLGLPVRKDPPSGTIPTCDLFLVPQWPQRYRDMLGLNPGDDADNVPAALQAKVAAELISDLLDGFAYFDDEGKLCDLRAEMDEIVEETADA